MERKDSHIPEGPELLHSRDRLSLLLTDRQVVSVKFGGRYSGDEPHNQPWGFPEFHEALRKHPFLISKINVKGKFMWWELSSPTTNTWHMWCTYGMSGQWVPGKPDKHAAATIQTHIESDVLRSDVNLVINFRDPRHFGTLKFIQVPNEGKSLTDKKLSVIGPDMLGSPPDFDTFIAILKNRSTMTLAQALMNQNIVSGVGNYIKSEALYRARLSPHRILGSLTDIEMSHLYREVTAVMHESYQAKGATIRSYRTPEGHSGAAQFRFQVYGRKEDDFGNVVVREETLDKRTTHWVPSLQL
jgi:formamidopyrimidine-DNA glycosylase